MESRDADHYGESSRGVRAVLVLLLVVGFAVRLYPILWGSLFYDPDVVSLHADEPKLVRYMEAFPESLTTAEDYRIPTLLHNTYGAAWAGLRALIGPPRGKPSGAGTLGYERALILGRALSVLVFGLGGSWLLWRFTRRLAGPHAGLFAVAVANSMGWWVSSAALVQADVPMAVGLLLLFHLLLRVESEARLTLGQALGVGAALGAATATKYTAAAGALAIAVVVLVLWRHRRVSLARAARFLGAAAAAAAVVFVFFVPAVWLDRHDLARSIEYEFDSKIVSEPLPASLRIRGLFLVLPAWSIVLGAVGFALAWRRGSRATLLGLVLMLAAILSASIRSFRPDYGMPVVPFAAAFIGLLLGRLRGRFGWRATAVAVPLLVLGQLWTFWVVHQRYAADPRYEFVRYVRAEIPPGPIGGGPTPIGRGWDAPRLPKTHTFVPVHGHPEWIVLHERGYRHCLEVLRGVSRFEVDPLDRVLYGLKERDFRFYEDVLLGLRREFRYDEVMRWDPPDVPLDMQSFTVHLLRRSR